MPLIQGIRANKTTVLLSMIMIMIGLLVYYTGGLHRSHDLATKLIEDSHLKLLLGHAGHDATVVYHKWLLQHGNEQSIKELDQFIVYVALLEFWAFTGLIASSVSWVALVYMFYHISFRVREGGERVKDEKRDE